MLNLSTILGPFQDHLDFLQLKAESPFIRGRDVCVSVYMRIRKKNPSHYFKFIDSIYACTYIQVRMRKQKYGCNHFLSDFLHTAYTAPLGISQYYIKVLSPLNDERK